MRILCFSETCTNPLLWGHYADRGRGICLGFHVNQALPVEYKCDRIQPGREIREQPVIGIGMDVAFVKSWHWRHEKEWRMWERVDCLDLCPITGLHYFRFGERLKLCEILIGPRCEEKEDNMRYRLEKLTADYEPKPEIAFLDLSRSHFAIEEKRA